MMFVFVSFGPPSPTVRKYQEAHLRKLDEAKKAHDDAEAYSAASMIADGLDVDGLVGGTPEERAANFLRSKGIQP